MLRNALNSDFFTEVKRLRPDNDDMLDENELASKNVLV